MSNKYTNNVDLGGFDQSFETKDAVCPHCGIELSGAAGPAAPKEGDVTMCINCAGICIFNDDLTLRFPDATELAELEADPNVSQVRLFLRQQISERQGRLAAETKTVQ